MREYRLFFLCLTVVGCTDLNPKSLDQLILENEIYLDGETMDPYSGPVREYFPGTESLLRRKGYLVDGMWDGLYEYYYENGQIKFKNTYNEGVWDGLAEEYYRNGQLRRRENYKNNALDGLAEEYFEDGQLRRRESYQEDVLNGQIELYDEAGQLLEKGRGMFGLKCGEWIEYGKTLNHRPCLEK